MTTKLFRYSSGREFPPYRYLPGVYPHPNGRGGYRENFPDPVAHPLLVGNPFPVHQNEIMGFAVDLFNHEYFWEAHVYWEALWNAHARSGETADFIKALVKIAAAGVKLKSGELIQSRSQLQAAREFLLNLQERVGETYLGFSIPKLVHSVSLALHSESKLFEIHPER